MKHSPAAVRSFDSIEQLDEFHCGKFEWPLEYRQLKPGSFFSTFTELEGDSWFLMEEQNRQTVEVNAGAVSGMYMLALAEGTPVKVSGQILDTSSVFLQSPDSCFHATLPTDTKVTQIGITVEMFEQAVASIAPDIQVPQHGAAMYAASADSLACIRQAVRQAMFAAPDRQVIQDESTGQILTSLVSAITNYSVRPAVKNLHSANSRRVLNKAREYIEAHLDEELRITSVCSYAGTTLRTLERIFAREYGLTPQQYVLSRRLNAIRRKLVAAESGQKLLVSDLAGAFGFAHMGRFAKRYRSYFGESPSQTLQS